MDAKIKVLIHEFCTRVWSGQKPLQEQRTILQVETIQLNTLVNQSNKVAVEKYIEIQYKKLKSKRLLIEQIRIDKDLLTSLQTNEQINLIFQEIISSGSDKKE